MADFYVAYPESEGVNSVNSLTGDITLAAGTGITITPSGNTLTIAATGGSGANVTLSNLTSPTAVNQNLIFATGADAVVQTQNSAVANTFGITLQSGNATGFASGNIAINSGIVTGIDASGSVLLASGDTEDGDSGEVGIKSGFASAADSGNAYLRSGQSFNESGQIDITTGDAGNDDSGDIIVSTGQVNAANTPGSILLTSAAPVDAVGGNIELLCGGASGSGTQGDILLRARNVNVITPSTGGLVLGDGSGLVPLKFFDNFGAYVGFVAPATVVSSQTYTLPDFDGAAGDVLTTDGSQTLSWEPASGLPNARVFASTTTISSTLATIVFDTVDFDTASAYSAGVYTVPVVGKYQVNARVTITGTIGNPSTQVLQIQKNGTAVSEHQDVRSTGNAKPIDMNASDIISCTGGDTIQIQVSTTMTSPTITASNTRNYFSLVRIG